MKYKSITYNLYFIFIKKSLVEFNILSILIILIILLVKLSPYIKGNFYKYYIKVYLL